MRPSEYIDALRQAYNLQSDYAVAKLLQIKTQQVYQYRKDTHHFGDDVAIRVASLLGIDATQVIGDSKASQAHSEVTRTFWKRLADSTRKVPVNIAL